MAHYALLDNTNTVVQVITGVNEWEIVNEITDWETYYSQATGYRVLRTSFNTLGGQHLTGGVPFRGNFAGVGYEFDETLDAFIPPKPHPSWILDENKYNWYAPIPYPADGEEYVWDETLGDWVAA
jgi:hypothetical protein